MFKKLLSNLPFNPSLITQVSFYAKRLHRESSLRRLGLIFVSLSLCVQTFAVISPAEASNQCSSNDIVRCGFTSKAEAVQRCNSNAQGFRTILGYYGVSCDTLANATTKNIKSTDYGNQLFSMGRNPYQKPGEYNVAIQGAGNFYMRPLSSWDSAGASTYRMLVMQTPDSQPFMVMYDCANIVTKKGYTPPAKVEPPSLLKLAKVNKPTGTVKPGEIIEYSLAFTNSGGTAAFFSVNDELPPQLEYIDSQYGNWIFERNGSQLKWYNNNPPFHSFGNTDALGTPGFIIVRAKVKNTTPSGTNVCNRAWLSDINTQTKQPQSWSEAIVCNSVEVQCPSGQIPSKSGGCETPKVASAKCTYLKPIQEISRTKHKFEAKSAVVNGATVTGYSYNFGDGSPLLSHSSKSLTDTVEHEFNKPGNYKITVTIQTSAGNKDGLSCEFLLNIEPKEATPTPLIAIHKQAKNITKNITDANGTTAYGNDVIEYSLITTNYGKGVAKDILLRSEEIADILEYADLDMNSLDGGIFDNETNTLAWNKPVTIKPGDSVVRTFKIKIKDPVPQTPSPVGNPGSFDLKLTNVYGNTIEILLPTTVTKATEQITKELPSTGPGESLLAASLITILAGYFFARSRLMAKEVDIIKAEYVSSGS